MMMNKSYREQVEYLLSQPELLIQKKPFTRGATMEFSSNYKQRVGIGERVTANLPKYNRIVVSQEQYLRELDPNCHNVLFDENIPSLCMKIKNRVREIEYEKMAIPFQENIRDKQVLHLTGNKMQFTLVGDNPTEQMQNDFVTFKQYWDMRNQDGMKNKMVSTQKSVGDAGLLYYFDRYGRIKSRLLSFEDGYVLCPHNDDNGDRILESVYYSDGDGILHIDSYDDTYMTSWTSDGNADTNGGWVRHDSIPHGFNEIPLITKRGQVAWDNVQYIIDSYEILYNVFNAIQKRFGWGILYVKGKFKSEAKKLAGSVVLNDTSMENNGDAKFLAPPTPDGTIATLELMEKSIQKGAGTTFILPQDVTTTGDISGIAVQITQSLDIETAEKGVIDWQNVADKMTRLFKYGLSKELVNSGVSKTAVSDFENLNISAKFKVWKPMNDYEYNQMLVTLKGAGILSKKTAIEKNTESAPDELARVSADEKSKKEEEANAEQMKQKTSMQQEIDKIENNKKEV